MPRDSAVVINGSELTLVSDSQLPKGKRAWTRAVRPSQPSDPGIHKVARWDISGPAGESNETRDGRLSTDYTENMDTRYDALLLPSAKPNFVNLTTFDPPQNTLTLPFTIPNNISSFTDDVSQTGMHYFEQQGSMVWGRGNAVTFVSSSFGAFASDIKPQPVRGMTSWKGSGRIGYGAADEVETLDTITISGGVYSTETGLYAGAMTAGTDRWWAVSGESGQENKLFFSLDNLQSFSDPFPVNDDAIPVTGIGTLGPFTIAASEVGASSFTDLGRPRLLIESVKDFRDRENGKDGDSLWGWYYQPTKLGLFAIIPGQIANPVGIEALTQFEGEIDGYPTAVRAWKDSLWVAYLSSEGDTYVLRGMFGPETRDSGIPLWYPFAKIEDARCDIIRGTSLAGEPTIQVGTNSSITYYTLAFKGREITGPEYKFFTGESKWYGSRMIRNANMHKSIRYFVVITQDLDEDNYFQVQASIDGGAYVDIGDPVMSGTHKYIRPVQAGIPQTNANGHTIKPRVVCVSDNEDVPPKMIGALEMVYDERPDTIIEHAFMVRLERPEQDFDHLRRLLNNHGQGASSPFIFQYPNSFEDHYGLMVGIERAEDIAGDGVEAVIVKIQEWAVEDVH